MAAAVVPHYWAAVEDCLVTLHRVTRCEAAQKVTSLWRRLPSDGSDLADMIYHAEPWQIACNLMDHDLQVECYQAEYQGLLARHRLAPAPKSD